MVRKPTPLEIAEFITEDQYGNPGLQSLDQSALPDSLSAGPDFDQGSGPDEPDDSDGHGTEMQSCSALTCTNNRDGVCGLKVISINDHGGCDQYEASADDVDDSRYQEHDSDESGNTQITKVQPGDQERQWETGKWDPRGGGY